MPSQQRPIVILALLIRLWSSTWASHALQQLGEIAPEGLGGGFPAREASDIFGAVAAFVEASYANAFDAHGTVFDIKKALNRLPRIPVLTAAEHVGFPMGTVAAWGAYLSNLDYCT